MALVERTTHSRRLGIDLNDLRLALDFLLHYFSPLSSELAPSVGPIVAVHGLASNPATTWGSLKPPQSPGVPPSNQKVPKRSWLCDLPKDIPNARIMTFNHNTAWQGNALSKSLNDHADDLLRSLDLKREAPEEKARPIIFIGHSFGGLIIKQAIPPMMRGLCVCPDRIVSKIKSNFTTDRCFGRQSLDLKRKKIALLQYWNCSDFFMIEKTIAFIGGLDQGIYSTNDENKLSNREEKINSFSVPP
ncbi:hypothetical protein BU17DRAFT_96884 [Hysterangium stoloniferum]|nr:hypothetical protein BU17DRAFT_96884 [Hysterangium stoloniferum]